MCQENWGIFLFDFKLLFLLLSFFPFFCLFIFDFHSFLSCLFVFQRGRRMQMKQLRILLTEKWNSTKCHVCRNQRSWWWSWLFFLSFLSFFVFTPSFLRLTSLPTANFVISISFNEKRNFSTVLARLSTPSLLSIIRSLFPFSNSKYLALHGGVVPPDEWCSSSLFSTLLSCF